ncbi:MAG: hypothetical protein ACJ8G7_01935 [Rhizobacter sp.]
MPATLRIDRTAAGMKPLGSGRAARGVSVGSRRPARGLSLVELLVGMATGLLVTAGGLGLMAVSARESRALSTQTRLAQDLHAAAGLMSRELRRAGYWAGAERGLAGATASTPASNPHAEITPADSASSMVVFRYSRDGEENGAIDTEEEFGFRLRNGTIEMQLGASNWQALTDSTSLQVMRFTVTPRLEEINLGDSCPNACPAASATCPPRLLVRSLELQISARSADDPAMMRTASNRVRLRNDALVGTCAAPQEEIR